MRKAESTSMTWISQSKIAAIASNRWIDLIVATGANVSKVLTRVLNKTLSNYASSVENNTPFSVMLDLSIEQVV